MVGLLRPTYVVLFTETFYPDSKITHELYLHHVCKGLFHAPEIKSPTNKQRQGH